MESKSLSRTSWLDAALRALDEGGVDAVKVLPLAERLGVTRGSFYWHFKNREDLLEALIEFWERRHTEAVLARATDAEGDARARLLALMEAVLQRREGRFESAIRSWARHDRKAAAAVRRADRDRLAFVTGLFREMGFSEDDSEARARVVYLYLLGDHAMFAKESATRRKELLVARHRVLTEGASCEAPAEAS